MNNKPHFYNGNIKVGNMLTFNKLAGNNEINGCKGSCGTHCGGCWDAKDWKKSPCYVAKSYVQYGDMVVKSHIVNTLAMRNDLQNTIEDLNRQLQRKRTLLPVRIHSSGELESAAELKAWFWLAKQNPKRTFYVYTKAYEIVDEVLSGTKASDLPTNFFINISIWHEHGIECYKKWNTLEIVRAFIYDDGVYDYKKAGINIEGHCPAYKKDTKGKVKLSHDLTCDKCKLCMQNKVKVLTCLSH